jgi:hypothetical protein
MIATPPLDVLMIGLIVMIKMLVLVTDAVLLKVVYTIQLIAMIRILVPMILVIPPQGVFTLHTNVAIMMHALLIPATQKLVVFSLL